MPLQPPRDPARPNPVDASTASRDGASTATTGRRAVTLAVIGGLLLLGACAWLFYLAVTAFPSDLSAVYIAGHLFDIGRTDILYDAPETFFGTSPPLWEPHIESLGLTGQFVTPYVYPPLWAAVVAPISLALTPEQFFFAAALVQIPLLGLSPLLAWRIADGSLRTLGVWLILSSVLLVTSMISIFAVKLLQPQILVVFLILWAFERYRTGRSATAGALLALAAAIKLAPAAFALIFVMDRNWRSLGTFLAVCAAIGLVGFVAAGVELHLTFLDSLKAVSGTLFLSSTNFAAGPLMAALGGATGFVPPVDLSDRNVVFDGAAASAILLLNKVLFVALLAAVFWKSRMRAPRDRLVVRLISVTLLVNLFGPLGWIHYNLLPLLLLPALPRLMRPAIGYALFAGIAVATSRQAFWALHDLGPGDLGVVSVGVAGLIAVLLAVNVAPSPRPTE
ncbi:glycosyltransferase family 87 protein [Tropicimonas isoalkanivorans]|uniref:Alpha-1,2-mannosyltransferase n=1 Tax=Tropicimonas isoalkanivorans TaxID=441112 RepID=A0A1I1NJY3_9RHOB|nr:glycosyltransferase family 87 protein [Tropicimonas isoalkanivorans]SFC95788.1 Protein of unknown function [Tropicimonas isoalkanivorans]